MQSTGTAHASRRAKNVAGKTGREIMSAQKDGELSTRHPRPCACMGHWRPDRRGLLPGVPATSLGPPTSLAAFPSFGPGPAQAAEGTPGRGQKILIKAGNVVTMNDDKRDFTPGDILIDGDRIAAVDHKIDAADAFIIDARGMIVIPGMIDTHRHTWQSTVHAVGPDWLLNDYFRVMRGVLGLLIGRRIFTSRPGLARSRQSIRERQRLWTRRIS